MLRNLHTSLLLVAMAMTLTTHQGLAGGRFVPHVSRDCPSRCQNDHLCVGVYRRCQQHTPVGCHTLSRCIARHSLPENLRAEHGSGSPPVILQNAVGCPAVRLRSRPQRCGPDQCTTQAQCPGDQLCCSDGCRRTCKRNSNIGQHLVTTESCPPGWHLAAGVCIRLAGDSSLQWNQSSWLQARALCQGLGADLATPHTPARLQAMRDIDYTFGIWSFFSLYVGLEKDSSNNWTWLNGQPMTFHWKTNLSNNQTSAGGEKNCAEFDYLYKMPPFSWVFYPNWNGFKKVRCNQRSVMQYAACQKQTVRRVAPKPGSCPTTPSLAQLNITSCIDECSGDYHCPGFKKCCQAGCARRCVGPCVLGLPGLQSRCSINSG